MTFSLLQSLERTLDHLTKKIRYQLIEMSHFGKAPHLGSSLSCVDLVTLAYNQFLKIDPRNPTADNRDRFILSKGHAITTLYAVLAFHDFFPKKWLKDFNQDGKSLPEHPTPKCVPGVELASGSLGHGLSVGVGHALAAKIRKMNYKVMVLLSDGECNEGSTWEGAMFAPKHHLSNLCAIVDFNKWQATGRSEDILSLSPLREKWESFGWKAYEIDGHNFSQILDTFAAIKEEKKLPSVIIANTIKGKGIDFMEDDNNWHYRIPNSEELQKCKKILGLP